MTTARSLPRLRRAAPALFTLLLVFLVCALSAAPRARAHADLDEAKRLMSDLEFDAALMAFDAALNSGTLTREELVALLSERAFVFHALRRQEELIQDFLWLSALAPDHRLDLRAPPDLTATWTSVRDQGRGVLKVALSAETTPDGRVNARASLTGTVPEGARARLWLRRGSAAFQLLPQSELHEAEAGTSELALYADGLILGGVALPGEYSADEPLRIQPAAGVEPNERGWASRHKGWLIGGAVLVAAAGVVAGVLLSRDGNEHSDHTDLKPMVTF
jgi:hypothetical protein